VTALHAARTSPARSLGDWLAGALGGAWTYVGQASGNSHESLIFRKEVTGERVVVRLEPQTGPFPSYDVIAEADLLSSLSHVGIPVPQVLGADPTGAICGSAFIVTEWIPGQVFSPGSVQSVDAQVSLISRMLEPLVQIHRVQVRSLIGPADEPHRFHRTFDDISAEFAAALIELTLVDTLVLDYARAWLASTRSLVSAGDEVLVHGDFRLANLLWEPDGTCRVLDWESAHIGSRLFDLAWLCMGAVKNSERVMGLVPKETVVLLYEELSGVTVYASDLLWWQVAAAWIRGCTEARLLDSYLTAGDSAGQRDPQELLWEFGSYRTDREILSLIERFEEYW
jgi:aminoglycoside phosphotransferase (APT) family kinase protein